MANSFEKTIKYRLDDAKRMAIKARSQSKVMRSAAFKRIARRMDALPSLDEASYVTISFGYASQPDQQEVTFGFQLKEEVKAPQLVRDLIRSGMARKLMKTVSYTGGSLQVKGDLFTDLDLPFKVHVNVEGYVPNTCKIIEVEEYVPAQTVKKVKVVCGPNDLDSSAGGTDLEVEITSADQA